MTVDASDFRRSYSFDSFPLARLCVGTNFFSGEIATVQIFDTKEFVARVSEDGVHSLNELIRRQRLNPREAISVLQDSVALHRG